MIIPIKTYGKVANQQNRFTVLYLKKEKVYTYIHTDHSTLTLHSLRKITLRSDYRVLNG